MNRTSTKKEQLKKGHTDIQNKFQHFKSVSKRFYAFRNITTPLDLMIHK